MPTNDDGDDRAQGARAGGSAAVVDAHLHLEIAGARVHGTVLLDEGAAHDFDGWAGLIGAVLAVAGHEGPPSLAPEVRRRSI